MSKSIVSRFRQAFERRREEHSGIRRLEQLDDRLLADIGISRSEIRHAAIKGRGYLV